MSNSSDPNHPYPLLVVIVNYRTSSLTIDCLRSLVSEVQSLPGMRVAVADNASGDSSTEQIPAAIASEGWSEWASFVPLDRNGGFAFGNNALIRPVLQSPNPPPYFLLLNPDTIVRPGALKALVDFMETHPDAGIAGSRLEDPDGTPQESAFRFHTLASEFDFGWRLGPLSKLLKNWAAVPPLSQEICQTDWVAGASMIVRREVFEKIGLMDEAYFMYCEEMDFCLQANKAGWSCWYVPESRVVHLVGQSSGVTDTKAAPKRMPTYWFDSRRRYFIKNYGFLYTALTDVCWASGFAAWRVRRAVQGKPDRDPPNYLKDFLLNSVFFKGGEIEKSKNY
ncbi:glycosyltransferase family 2 protein [Microcoleus sp. OTE_8_concoct_300]|uniref:glycosyltransferase family 2 protein n=1 Tax=Microcoleus sp. OTE_8_concoct_300 TaxID=2964710 RepID=UPI00403F1607